MSDEDLDAEYEELGTLIRSLLTSIKNGCTVDEFTKEFKSEMFQTFPNRKFGFPTASDLLRDMPDVVKFGRNKEGQIIITAVTTEDTKHVADLVKGQKKSRSRSASSRRAMSTSRRTRSYQPPGSMRNGFGGRQINSTSLPNANFFRKDFRGATSNVNGQAPRRAQSSPPSSTFGQTSSRFDNPFEKSPKSVLDELALRLGLTAPVYAEPSSICKGTSFICSVKVGTHTAAGSLEKTKELAEMAAANSAVNLLTKIYVDSQPPRVAATNGNVGDELKEEDKEFEEIMENILLLLDKYPSGIVAHSLAKKYAEQYQKLLPSDWLKQIEENAPEISLTFTGDEKITIVAKSIVRPLDVRVEHPLLLAPGPRSSTEEENMFDSQVDAQALGEDDVPLPPASVFTSDKIIPIQISHGKIPEHQDKVPEHHVNGGAVPRRSVVFNEEKNEVKEFELSDEERARMFQGEMEVPPWLTLPAADDWEAYAVIVQCPSTFVIQLMNYADDYQGLRLLIDDYYKNNSEIGKIETEEDFTSTTAATHRYFFAAESEESWHRVTLIEVLGDQRAAKMYFIDHGDDEIVPFDKIRFLRPEFLEFPAQAVKGCLKGFENWTFDDFDGTVIERFRELVFDKGVTAKLCGNGGGDEYDDEDTLSFILFTTGDTPQCVNELIEQLVPTEKFLELQVVEKEVDAQVQPQSVATEHVSPLGNAPVSFQSIMDENTRLGSNEVDAPQVPPPLNTVDSQVSQKSLSIIDVQVDDNPFVSPDNNNEDEGDASAPLKAFVDFGDSFECLVVFAADPSQFSVQPAAVVEPLKALMSEMQEFYNISPPDLDLQINSGDFYAAKINGAWFRVSYVSVVATKCLVFLVDYGEFSSCDKGDVQRLVARFRRLPMAIVQCSVHNAKPYERAMGSYDYDGVVKFGRRFCNKKFIALVRGRCFRSTNRQPELAHAEVDLIDEISGESLTDWLVNEKIVALRV